MMFYQAGTDALSGFQHTMDPQLRKLGLPTQLMEGKIALMGPYVVCREGEPLTSNAAQLLRLLRIPLGTFKLVLKGTWDSKNHKATLH